MRVLIVEEALEGLHGHYFQYLRDMVDGGRKAGHQIDVLAHRGACERITREIGGIPWLRRTVHGVEQPRSPLQRLARIAGHNRSLRDDVLRWSGESGKRYDVTLFPTVRIDHVWAIESIRRSDRADNLGRLVAILIDAPGYRNDDGSYSYPKSSLPLRQSLKWIARSHRFPIIFAAESDRMVNQFRDFSGVSFVSVPHVTQVPSEVIWRGLASQHPSSRLRFGTFGFTRYDKGLDILQEAIKKLPVRSGMEAEFLIQWTGNYALPGGEWITPDPELVDHDGVEYIPAFAGSQDYHERLRQIDAVILPYRKEFYRDRMSRVSVDAALVGLPVVYPKDTWLEDFHEEFGAGVSFEAEDPDSLAAAVLDLVMSYPAKVEASRKNIERTRAAFSGERFFSIIEQTIS